MSKKRKTHLVIGDAHSSPGTSNRRFDWLANFIEDKKPDVIVDIGDWGDLDSIGKYAKGKKDAWGLTFKNDAAAFRDASKRAFGRINRIKGYKPRLIRLGGNHDEGRISKLINENPELEGAISLDHLGVKDYGAEFVNFNKIKVIDGVAYSHYFYDKDSRFAMGSARVVLQKKLMSCTWGHSHLRDMAEGVGANGRRSIALNVGAFLDIDQSMSYAGTQGNARWWRGLVLKHDVNNGEYDPEFFGIKRIKELYS